MSSMGKLEQWASRLLRASSQYDSCGWAGEAVVGAPKVYPQYGDIQGAWAPGIIDGNQFIEVEFETSVYVSAINIYETYHSGGVERVCVRSPRGEWDAVWSTDTVQNLSTSRIFSPNIQRPSYRTRAVRVDIDCTCSGTWVEIDAVQLVGTRLKFDAEVPETLPCLSADLRKLVNDKATSDVVLSSKDGDVRAHRAILSVRSEKLREKLLDTSKTYFPMEEFSQKSLLGVMHYIYSGSIPQDFAPRCLVEVWRAALSLEMGALQVYCLWTIDDRLTVDNVISTYVCAAEMGPKSDDIIDICMEFIASNLASVSLCSDFKDLPQALMLEVVQQSAAKMRISENR